jgi:hypothetical protein
MKKLITLLPLVLLSFSHPVMAADWRQTAEPTDKINKLIQVMPGASVIMQQMGERYRNLYWAAKQGQWEFAEYQIEEMDDLIQTLMITRPKRAKTANKFMQTAFKLYPAALKENDWQRFNVAFENMRQQCMTCHVENKHSFIVLPQQPRKGNSVVLETAK